MEAIAVHLSDEEKQASEDLRSKINSADARDDENPLQQWQRQQRILGRKVFPVSQVDFEPVAGLTLSRMLSCRSLLTEDTHSCDVPLSHVVSDDYTVDDTLQASCADVDRFLENVNRVFGTGVKRIVVGHQPQASGVFGVRCCAGGKKSSKLSAAAKINLNEYRILATDLGTTQFDMSYGYGYAVITPDEEGGTREAPFSAPPLSPPISGSLNIHGGANPQSGSGGDLLAGTPHTAQHSVEEDTLGPSSGETCSANETLPTGESVAGGGVPSSVSSPSLSHTVSFVYPRRIPGDVRAALAGHRSSSCGHEEMRKPGDEEDDLLDDDTVLSKKSKKKSSGMQSSVAKHLNKLGAVAML